MCAFKGALLASFIGHFAGKFSEHNCLHLPKCDIVTLVDRPQPPGILQGNQTLVDATQPRNQRRALQTLGKSSRRNVPFRCGFLSEKFYITGRRTCLQLFGCLLVLVSIFLGRQLSFSRCVVSVGSKMVPGISKSPPNSVNDTAPLVNRLVNEGRADFGNLLDLFSSGKPDAVAVGEVDGRTPMTYSSLRLLVRELDLTKYGFPPNSVVATLMPAGDHAVTLLMMLHARYVAVPLNASLTHEELASALRLFQIEVVLTVTETCDKLYGCLPRDVGLIEVIPDAKLAGVFHLHERLKTDHSRGGGPATTKRQLNGPDDHVLLLGTSGTTSAPKIVPITLRRLAMGAHVWAEAFGIHHGDRSLNMMPLYHVGGIVTNVLALLISGASVICAPNFSREEFVTWMQEFRITYYSAVPTMHQQITKLLGEADSEAVARVRIHLRIIATGAAHLPHTAALELAAVTGATVLPTYGMTECMPIAIAPREYFSLMVKPDTVGIPICSVCLFNESGMPVSTPSDHGEVCVRGPLVLPEYLSGGKATWHTSSDARWFRTGDLATLDCDGYLKLVGRAKEVINRGGELISPFEIESMTLTSDAVEQCMAFSATHEELGETVALAVVPKANEVIDLGSLRQLLLKGLTPVKVPEVIVVLDELPKGATGKLSRLGFSDQLGLGTFSMSTPLGQRLFKAQRQETVGEKAWRLHIIGCGDGESALPHVSDSLGLPSRGSDTSQEVIRIITCLYAPASIAIMAMHTLGHTSFDAFLDDIPPLFLALFLKPDWAMYIFFAGAAATDRASNIDTMPNFGQRDLLWIMTALAWWQCNIALTPLTCLFMDLVVGRHDQVNAGKGCGRLWFFPTILLVRVFLVTTSRLRMRPAIQIGVYTAFACVGIPPFFNQGSKGSEWYLFGAMYLWTYHYGLEISSYILRSLREFDTRYSCLCPRIYASLILLICPMLSRTFDISKDCGSSKFSWPELTVQSLYPYQLGEMSVRLLAERICITPIFLGLNALLFALAFVALSKAPFPLHYLGNGALGTYILGAYVSDTLASSGISIHQVNFIPSMNLCGLLASKYAPNSDSLFLSLSQWISLFIFLFPAILFAATFGRLYQECLLLLFKAPRYFFSWCFKF